MLLGYRPHILVSYDANYTMSKARKQHKNECQNAKSKRLHFVCFAQNIVPESYCFCAIL